MTTHTHNIAIFNGHIVGDAVFNNGFPNGISWSTTEPRNVRVMDVSVSGCGMNGVDLGIDDSTIVERCTVRTVGGRGIEAGVVSHSTAKECGGDAMEADNAIGCTTFNRPIVAPQKFLGTP